jgi:hypothetical protein
MIAAFQRRVELALLADRIEDGRPGASFEFAQVSQPLFQACAVA